MVKHNVLGRIKDLKVLKLKDYVLADYRQAQGQSVNFYVAYYESQKRRAAPHSPKVCIPGGGWEIAGMERIDVAKQPVNRLLIKKGLQKQLVYYWYQQRGRKVANEFMMKWTLFQDALFLNRTDGALVRLTTPIGANESEAAAEQRLREFLMRVDPVLNDYIPV
jgi:EpsI family protein